MGTSNAAKNAREGTHGGNLRHKLVVTLAPGATQAQADNLRAKLEVLSTTESVAAQHFYTGGFGGRTLIQQIEEQMDKRRMQMQRIVVETGATKTSPQWVANKGRYEGFGQAIATLRSSSLKEEIYRSNERLGIS